VGGVGVYDAWLVGRSQRSTKNKPVSESAGMKKTSYRWQCLSYKSTTLWFNDVTIHVDDTDKRCPTQPQDLEISNKI